MKFKLFIDPHQDESIHAHLKQKNEFSKQLEQFVNNYDQSHELFGLDADKNIINLSFDSITLITIIDQKTYAITTNNQELLLKARLYQIAKKLPNYFWKINKSSIVNRHEIKKFSINSSAGVNVILKNGISDYVSRRCFAKIRKELKK